MAVLLRKRAQFLVYHPRFLRVRDHLWRDTSAEDVPPFSAFAPQALQDLLSLINLIEIVTKDGIARYRYRLHGARQTKAAGRDITGQFLDDAILPASMPRVLANMESVRSDRGPVYDRFPMPHATLNMVDSERVYYPLRASGDEVDRILILHGYFDAEIDDRR